MRNSCFFYNFKTFLLFKAVQNQMMEKSETVTKLHEQMQWLETSADEVKFEVNISFYYFYF